jgi:fucose permease
MNYSSVMGIIKAAHLTASQFSWLGSIFFLGYIVALAPHNRLLQQALYTIKILIGLNGCMGYYFMLHARVPLLHRAHDTALFSWNVGISCDLCHRSYDIGLVQKA